MKLSPCRILCTQFVLYMVVALSGCGGGGGGSSPPSPSVSSNLPSAAFDDETIVVTVTARNFGSGDITYNATSNSLSIEQGNSSNQFVIRGYDSELGNHTISFSASDPSGKSATLNSTIRIDAVVTGFWQTQSLSLDGISTDDISASIVVSREGRVYLEAYTYGYWDEKCFGSGSISVTTLSFEVWCANFPDGYQVTDENYRLAGEIEVDGDYARGEYSLYGASGGLLGTVDAQLERLDLYGISGLLAPSDAKGVYLGNSDANYDELIAIDNDGRISPVEPGGTCDVEGSVAQVDIDLIEGNTYISRGIYDARPLSQRGCIDPNGNALTGNRDILSGEGILLFISGIYWGWTPDDDKLFIFMSDSVNSYGGIPSFHEYWRVCTASGDATEFAYAYGFYGVCSSQSNGAGEKSPAAMSLQKLPEKSPAAMFIQKHSKTLPDISPNVQPHPNRQAQ